MKRFAVVVLAALACLALGSLAVADSSSTTKVKSKVTLKYTESGTPPYNQSAFSGNVKGKGQVPSKIKKACKKGRKVKVPGIGEAKTSSDGKYSIGLSAPAAPGTYQAKVKQKTVDKDGDKIICEKAKSKPVTVS